MMTALMAFLIFVVGLHVLSNFLVSRRYAAPPPRVPVPQMPSVTLLRPVCGLENGLEQTLASGFAQDSPGYDLIHCVESADDPAVPLLRRLMAAHPQVRAQLLIGRDPISGNPKLNNLVKGWAAATGDWVVMADSNLLLPPDYLRQVLGRSGPGVGMTSSPGYGGQPQGLWARVEAGFLNTFQARWMLSGDAVGLGFAQGKTLAFPRDWLNERGGLIAMAGKMAEDIASTHMVNAAGLKVGLLAQPFQQPLGRRDFSAVWARQARWAQLRHEGFPLIYALEPLTQPVVLVPLLAFVWPAMILPFLLVWYGAEWYLARRANWPHGWRDLLAWMLRDLLQLPLWVIGWRRRRRIVWRGNTVTPTPGVAADGQRLS